MNESNRKAEKAYVMTRRLAEKNGILQGISGIVGHGVNLLVDVAVIPLYTGLWNDIRRLYGQGSITPDAALAYLRPNIPYLLEDILFDKLLGSVPILGIPVNAVYAKALTWRLGAWFTLLSSLGDDVALSVLLPTSLNLVRQFFPAGDMFNFTGMFRFRFREPDRAKFIAFIASVEGVDSELLQSRMERALRLLQGEEDETPEADNREARSQKRLNAPYPQLEDTQTKPLALYPVTVTYTVLPSGDIETEATKPGQQKQPLLLTERPRMPLALRPVAAATDADSETDSEEVIILPSRPALLTESKEGEMTPANRTVQPPKKAVTGKKSTTGKGATSKGKPADKKQPATSNTKKKANKERKV